MVWDFSDDVVVITGAASGIGRAAAELFVDHGADVLLADIDRAGMQDVATTLEEDHPSAEVRWTETDVSVAADVREMIETAVDAFDGITILFNNAGISHETKPVEDITEETWDRVLDVNLKSAFLAAKYAVPHLREQGQGVIINNASISADHPRPGTVPYASSNGGMVSMTRALAIELVGDNIRVNAINATATDTPLLWDLQSEREGTGYVNREQIVSSIPLGRLVTSEEVAYAALYLASDAANMITGACLPIGGGRDI